MAAKIAIAHKWIDWMHSQKDFTSYRMNTKLQVNCKQCIRYLVKIFKLNECRSTIRCGLIPNTSKYFWGIWNNFIFGNSFFVSILPVFGGGLQDPIACCFLQIFNLSLMDADREWSCRTISIRFPLILVWLIYPWSWTIANKYQTDDFYPINWEFSQLKTFPKVLIKFYYKNFWKFLIKN